MRNVMGKHANKLESWLAEVSATTGLLLPRDRDERTYTEEEVAVKEFVNRILRENTDRLVVWLNEGATTPFTAPPGDSTLADSEPVMAPSSTYPQSDFHTKT